MENLNDPAPLKAPSTKRKTTTRPRSWQPQFLTSLAEGHTVSKACEDAGITTSTAYQARGRDPEFFKEWDEAYESGSDLLEEEAWRRAKEGTVEDVYFQGQVVGQKRTFSDMLLVKLLEARRPEKYRARQEIRHAGDARPLTAEDLDLARSLGEDPNVEQHFEGLARALKAKVDKEGT
jgi:hypothetical protein